MSARAGVSRAAAAKLIAAGAVSIEGALATKSLRVEEAMRVSVSIPEHESAVPQAEEIPVRVVFEDEHLLVVSKPAGLVVHPAPGHSSGTLVNALLARAGAAPAGGDAERPGIVHRLDAGTSGLMIVTKDEETHAALTEALAARAVTRVYLALVEGIPDTDTTTIDAPIGRSTRDRKKMAVVAGGRPAVTEAGRGARPGPPLPARRAPFLRAPLNRRQHRAGRSAPSRPRRRPRGCSNEVVKSGEALAVPGRGVRMTSL